MSIPYPEIEAAALALPPEERGHLVTLLIRSFEPDEGEPAHEVEQAWAEEVARREAEIREGRVRGEPLEEVLARIRANLES